MQILGRFCLLVVVLSVLELYKGILQAFLGLLLMDCASCLKFLTLNSEFKGGFFVFGCFLPTFNILGLFLMFVLGLKFLQFSWYGKGLIQFLCDIRRKSSESKIGASSKRFFNKEFNPSAVKFLEDSKSGNKDNSLENKELVNPDSDFLGNNYERECYDEDDEIDVVALRRLVKIERMRADMACAELEEERVAAATAAHEAMAMILRLQSEKSSLEIEGNQYRRVAEQKQEYYEEVIESLKRKIMKQESERNALEENWRLDWLKLQQDMETGEVDQFEGSLSFLSSAMKDDVEDVLNNSVDVDSGFVSS